MRTRIKICGITRVEDALSAARLGADAIGLVFYPASPRAVDVRQARAIVAALPPFVSVVGLFVDAGRDAVEQVVSRVGVDLLQFHGNETAADCEGFGKPYLKAVRMRDGLDPVEAAQRYPDAAGLLLDSYVPGTPGGTGRTFDWSAIPADLPLPLVLAGGLTVDNVASAVTQVQPFAVDVSGGVEAAKGIKDAKKMAAFIANVQRVDCNAPQQT
jgi:phosphoribosylanthranilate isomerase